MDLLYCLLLMACAKFALGADSDVLLGEIHTIVSVECKAYFSFQMLALAFSHKRVGQPGPLTRIMGCSQEDLKKLSKEDMEMMNTHVTPQYTVDPETGDDYSPYNKPGGVLHWLQNAKPREEWVLMVDPDVIFRYPVTPEALYVEEGWVRAVQYHYMEDINNKMSSRYIPEVEPRNDQLGGRQGRRADEAGVFYLIRTKDMWKVASLWMNYTKTIRDDPKAWSLSVQEPNTKGNRIWVAEMYGWVYAAAKANVWHVLDPVAQVYPGYGTFAPPRLIHYGLVHEVLNYTFNKHHHMAFNHTKCPPWNLHPNRTQEDDAGLFPHPPLPHEIETVDLNTRYDLLLRLEFMNNINAALCERHLRMCSQSEELRRECGRVGNTRMALEREFQYLDKVICHDGDPTFCSRNKTQVDCKDNWIEMGRKCARFCGLCLDLAPKNSGLGSTRVVGPSDECNLALSANTLSMLPLVMLAVVLMVSVAALWRRRWGRCCLYKRQKSAL